ncbi:hypothetical protein PG993_009966 [Apiospora rasikravindrae]|uniref:Uncharacterized protein n=1 Tax=Apiospora rasikravindrae TaxID=990691 RepID=A0ABR1SM83_9PEZI
MPFSFTQTQPSTKTTGIRRPGPRPLVPDHQHYHHRQTEHSPRSTRRSPSESGHRERQIGCSRSGAIRRSPRSPRFPREASPPNLSRKTTPSPPNGRSRSGSETSDASTKIREHEETVRSQGVEYILQAKTYQPPHQNTTVISSIQPQTSHFSPSTESESSDNISTTSSLTVKSWKSPDTTPSQTPVKAQFTLPATKYKSSSSGHGPRKRPSNPSLELSLNKELPLLPATTYQPVVPKSKEALSSALKAAPPLPTITIHPEQENKSLPATVVASDTKIPGPKPIGELYIRRQKAGTNGDSTASATAVTRAPPTANDTTIPVHQNKGAAIPSSPGSIAARIGLQPLSTQDSKESPLRSQSPYPQHRSRNGSSDRSVRSEASSAAPRKPSIGTMYFTMIISPTSQQAELKDVQPPAHDVTEELAKPVVQDAQGGLEAKTDHVREDVEREMQVLIQEVDSAFRAFGTSRGRRAQRSGSGHRAVESATAGKGDIKAPSRLPPRQVEEKRDSLSIEHLNLSKGSKESKASKQIPQQPPSTPRDTTNKSTQEKTSALSRTSRKDMPPTPPPARTGQIPPSKGGREEWKRFHATERHRDDVKYNGTAF